jgi:hypothetical protein
MYTSSSITDFLTKTHFKITTEAIYNIILNVIIQLVIMKNDIATLFITNTLQLEMNARKHAHTNRTKHPLSYHSYNA